jgi:hypothetical protein
MYNTEFNVKYHDIEQELVLKLKNKTADKHLNENLNENLDENLNENLEEDSDEEYEYDTQDILDICDKLYRDELLSVFYAENMFDDKIEKGMEYIYNTLMINPDLTSIINDMKNILYLDELTTHLNIRGENKNNLDENIRNIVLYTLFSQNVFYITHKCICQQLCVGVVDNDLLVELRKHTVNILTNRDIKIN